MTRYNIVYEEDRDGAQSLSAWPKPESMNHGALIVRESIIPQTIFQGDFIQYDPGSTNNNSSNKAQQRGKSTGNENLPDASTQESKNL
jgi:hypothetical protein